MSSDRRKHGRVIQRMVARYDMDKNPVMGTVLNFSEVGMFVQSETDIPLGEKLSFLLGSGRDPLRLQGTVVWIKKSVTSQGITSPGGLGIALLAPAPEYLQFVEKRRVQQQNLPRKPDERFETYLRVTFRKGANAFAAYTENLSRGGLYIATDEALESGDILRIQLEIPGIDAPLRLVGRVVYRFDPTQAESQGRRPGVGVEFEDVKDGAREVLNHYIKRLEVHRSNPKRRFTGAIPTFGSLSEYLVPEILLHALQAKHTGTLFLQREGVKKSVFLRNGHPIAVQSSLWYESVGHYLVRQGKLKAQDLETSLQELEHSDLLHGELLLQKGLVDQSTLLDALVAHHEEKLSNTFMWFQGTFQLSKDSAWEVSSIFPLRTIQIIFDGIEKWYDPQTVVSWMGLHEQSLLKIIAMPPTELQVPPRILRLLRHISTPKTIEELSAELKIAANNLMSLAFGLVLSGWAQLDFSERKAKEKEKVRPQKVTSDPVPVKMTPETIKLLRARVDADLERLARLNFYELLRVLPTSDEKDLKRAFVERSSQYAAWQSESIDDVALKEKIAQILSWIQLAYDTLKDPTLRQVYARSGNKPTAQKNRSQKLEAERMLLHGIRDLEQGSARKAAANFTEAHRKHPTDPMIQGYLGWALFSLDPVENLKRSNELLELSLACNVSDPQLFYFQAEIYCHLGNWRRAERLYQRALKLYPNFVKAAAGLERATQKRVAEDRMTRARG